MKIGTDGLMHEEPLSPANRAEFIRQVEHRHLEAMNPVLTAFLTGLGTAVPAPFLPLFTPEELEVLLCGKPEIDIDLLKKVTEYDTSVEGVTEDAPHIQYVECWAKHLDH